MHGHAIVLHAIWLPYTLTHIHTHAHTHIHIVMIRLANVLVDIKRKNNQHTPNMERFEKRDFKLMLIIFNMPERKISDEVFRSCNHVSEYKWKCSHHVHIPNQNKSSEKADTHTLSVSVNVCNSNEPSPKLSTGQPTEKEKKERSASCIEINFQFMATLYLAENVSEIWDKNENIHVFSRLPNTHSCVHVRSLPFSKFFLFLFPVSSLLFVARKKV